MRGVAGEGDERPREGEVLRPPRRLPGLKRVELRLYGVELGGDRLRQVVVGAACPSASSS